MRKQKRKKKKGAVSKAHVYDIVSYNIKNLETLLHRNLKLDKVDGEAQTDLCLMQRGELKQ